MTAGDSSAWIPAVAGIAAAGLYVWQVIPRLGPGAALALSAALTLGGLAGASLGLPLLSAAVAVGFGHLGWALGRSGVPAAQRLVTTPASPAPTAAATRPAAAAPPTPAPTGDMPGRPLAAPERTSLGRYRIEALLGRGSMGAVYLGRDPTIGRQVAIKTLALTQEFEGEALDEARERFFREAETAGRLQHPGIVTIFDAGEDQGLAWIAMEYLRGHDLQTHTQAGRLLSPPDVLAVVARVAEALAYAHSQGVVHRDIKPANVMIDAATDSVKVTDFGIARIADASRTRTGLVLGTPSFMSPEQMAGRRVDGRSDLYSLGVMLFQLLTGELPFRAESMAKLMYQIANEPAPGLRSLRPDLPDALADVVALSLEKRPEVRYGDGAQLAADLRLLIPTLAPPAPVAEPVGSPAAPEAPPAVDPFAATVKFSRPDPLHNSQP